jgi:hypothetical protein
MLSVGPLASHFSHSQDTGDKVGIPPHGNVLYRQVPPAPSLMRFARFSNLTASIKR